MPGKLNKLETYVEMAQLSYQNCFKLGEFLAAYREPNGQYGIRLDVVRHMFNESWEDQATGSGHNKVVHRITGITVDYQNHGRDFVTPGAAETIAGLVQEHINIFFEQYVGYSVKLKRQREPDFHTLGERLMQMHAEQLGKRV